MAFGFRRREQPSLELYGKLAIARDYLRVGFSGDGALAFREWLDRGFSSAESPPRLTNAWRFIIGDAWDTAMQGIAWPSADAGGHRPFPFALGVRRKKRALLSDLDADLGIADGVWGQLATRFDLVREHADGRSMLAEARGIQLDVPAEAADTPDLDVERWLESIWPGAGARGFEADLSRLRGARFPTLRLPLARGLEARPQVSAWHAALVRLGVLPADQLPTLFFPLSPLSDQPFVLLFQRPPTPQDAAWLTDTGFAEGDFYRSRDSFADQRSAASGTSGDGPLRESVGQLVDRFLASSP